MVKQAAPTLGFIIVMSIAGCQQSPPSTSQSTPDLRPSPPPAPVTEVDNALRVGLRKSLTDYFIYRGRPRGFEYDLVMRYAKHLDRRISVRIVTDDAQLQSLIDSHEIDLWIPSEPWSGHPKWKPGPVYSHTDSVVIGWRGHPPKSVQTRAGAETTKDLTRWCAPPCMQQVVEANNDWELLERMAKNTAQKDVAAAVNRRHGEAFVVLDPRFIVVHGMGASKPVRWWYNTAKVQLEPSLKGFFSQGFRPRLQAALHARYFAAPNQMRMRARPWVRTDLAKRITRWDPDLRTAGRMYGIDWRLLAAVMMVESAQNRFATSSVGAQGLFQFMPATAKAIGLEDPSDPKESSRAAARYLKRLMRRFKKASSPYDQRMFALASYNVGQAHVDDARRLADRLGLDAEVWDQGISLTLPLLAQREFSKNARHGSCQGLVATRYAENVSDLYEQYSQLLPESLVDRDGGVGEP